MNFNHLYYFYVVAREGSVSGASRSLRVSQPSLSAQIKSFEESLGIKLFDRKGNKLHLTPTGKAVHSSAVQMFEIASSIPKYVQQGTFKVSPINLGIADEIERPFAVSLVNALFKMWNHETRPKISCMTGLSDNLTTSLREWSLDAIITNRPTAFDDLELVDTLVMPVFFATSITSNTKKKNAITSTPSDVLKWIDYFNKGLSVPSPRLKLRDELDTFLSKLGRTFPFEFESDNLAMVVRSIVDGVGVGFVPLPYIWREVKKRELTIFGPPDGFWKHSVFLIVKKGRAANSGVKEIIQAFSELKADVSMSAKELKFSQSTRAKSKA